MLVSIQKYLMAARYDLHSVVVAKIILISEMFMKNVALMIKMNLKGQFNSVITNPILTSMFFLLVVVRISIMSDRYPIKIKAEYIQFFACRNRIHPSVVVEEIKIIPLAVVIVNR